MIEQTVVVPTKKQLEFLNLNSDICIWSAGYGAGTSTLLLLLAFQNKGDTVVVDPCFTNSSINVFGAYDSPLVRSKRENIIELTNGNKLIFSKTYQRGLVEHNTILLNAHNMDNSQMKWIASYSGQLHILTQVVFDTKKWIRRVVLGMLSVGGWDTLWFDGTAPVVGSMDCKRNKSVALVQANVYDNPYLLKALPQYLEHLKFCQAGEPRKKAFGEWV